MGVLSLLNNNKNKIGFRCNEEFENMLKVYNLSKFQFDDFLSYLNIPGYKQGKKSILTLNARRVDKDGVLWDISCNGIDISLQMLKHSNKKAPYIRVNDGDNYCEYIICRGWGSVEPIRIYKCTDNIKFNNNAELMITTSNNRVSQNIHVKYNDDYRVVRISLNTGINYREWAMEDNNYLWLVDVFSQINDRENLSVLQLVNEMIKVLSGKFKGDFSKIRFETITIKNKKTDENEKFVSCRERDELNSTARASFRELYAYEFSKEGVAVSIHNIHLQSGLWFDVSIGDAKLIVEFNRESACDSELENIDFISSVLIDMADYLYNLKWPVSMEEINDKCLEFASNFENCSVISIKLTTDVFESTIKTENGECTYVKLVSDKETVEWKNDGSCSYTVSGSKKGKIGVSIDSESEIMYTGPLDKSLLEGKVFNPASMEMAQVVSTMLEKQKEVREYASGFSRKKS